MRARFSSFDGTESFRGALAHPATRDDLLAALDGPAPVIPRGAGLSYCAASAGSGVRAVSALQLDRVLDFDASEGRVAVEPGLRVGALLDYALARGFHPRALPGHPTITVGGCIGFNIHGKGVADDHFLDCVEELTVFHPDHGELVCSRVREPALFASTVGGFGLTGFVTRAVLRLAPLRGESVLRRREPVANLLEAVEVMRRHAPAADALYSWNDLNRRGDAFGRGFVYAERFQPERLPRWQGRYRTLDPRTRGRLLPRVFNRPGSVAFGRTWGALEGLRPSESRLDVRSAAFPIHGKEIYFGLFGRGGLREYQMLVPHAVWEATVREVEALLARAPLAVTMGSLKLFRGRLERLHFAGEGVCLTLDVAATSASRELFSHLDRLALDVGGIANLSKDSRLSGETVRRMYPEYERLARDLLSFDPKRRFDSALRRRIGI